MILQQEVMKMCMGSGLSARTDKENVLSVVVQLLVCSTSISRVMSSIVAYPMAPVVFIIPSCWGAEFLPCTGASDCSCANMTARFMSHSSRLAKLNGDSPGHTGTSEHLQWCPTILQPSTQTGSGHSTSVPGTPANRDQALLSASALDDAPS